MRAAVDTTARPPNRIVRNGRRLGPPSRCELQTAAAAPTTTPARHAASTSCDAGGMHAQTRDQQGSTRVRTNTSHRALSTSSSSSSTAGEPLAEHRPQPPFHTRTPPLPLPRQCRRCYTVPVRHQRRPLRQPRPPVNAGAAGIGTPSSRRMRQPALPLVCRRCQN